MRFLPLTLGSWLAFAPGLAAQVTVEVLLDQEQYLRDEALPLRVRLTNRSGQPLHLGREKDWLTFTIESREGFVVRRLGEMPVEGELTVESSQVATRLVDVAPYFDLSRLGRYTITASVKIKAWNEEVLSAPKPFDIVRGTKIWEQDFGVPAAQGAPEVRKYALLQANNLRQLNLYLRLTDASDHRVFRVAGLGRLVSFARPEAQLDRQSNLHVLFQNGARTFRYAVFSPDGEWLARETYEYAESRPTLRGRDDGKILVAGGLRRLTAEDITAPALTSSTNDVRTPKP
jgi:hypothetical protein